MKTIAPLFLAVLFSAAGLCAAETTVVFIPKITGNLFFESANEGAQKFAAQAGFRVEYLGSPQASVENQKRLIEAAIERRADAICISSVDATGLDASLKRAIAAGMVVTTWDSDVSGDARSLMVSQGTPEVLGEMLVNMGVKSLARRGKDPAKDRIRYVWHYSQAQVADQNSWFQAGEAFIAKRYPNWTNVRPESYFSEQDPRKALAVGEEILVAHEDIDLIICNDSTALPGQCQAVENFGLTKADITVTGFAGPNDIKYYCRSGIIDRWGLWDCQIQGALGCYLAYYLATGNKVKVGDEIAVPGIGKVEVLPNTVLDPNAYTAPDSGVVLLPERVEFTLENMDKYDF